jgi:hypothetical protein
VEPNSHIRSRTISVMAAIAAAIAELGSTSAGCSVSFVRSAAVQARCESVP